MAREELQLVANGCRKLNIELAKIFPQRTLEGVKGMRRNAKYKSLLSSFQAPSAALPGPSPSMVVVCDEESRGSTFASSPNDIVTGSIVPVNIVDLTEGRGSTPPKISNEISRSWDDIRTPERGEGLDVSRVLSSASPTRPSCNLGQSDASRAALDDGDTNLLFNPHERNRFDSWRESLLLPLIGKERIGVRGAGKLGGRRRLARLPPEEGECAGGPSMRGSKSCSVRTVRLVPNRYCRAIGFTR